MLAAKQALWLALKWDKRLWSRHASSYLSTTIFGGIELELAGRPQWTLGPAGMGSNLNTRQEDNIKFRPPGSWISWLNFVRFSTYHLMPEREREREREKERERENPISILLSSNPAHLLTQKAFYPGVGKITQTVFVELVPEVRLGSCTFFLGKEFLSF